MISNFSAGNLLSSSFQVSDVTASSAFLKWSGLNRNVDTESDFSNLQYILLLSEKAQPKLVYR